MSNITKKSKAQKTEKTESNRFTEYGYKSYALAIGQVALAWNDLHEVLGHLFWNIMGGGYADQPLGVWNSAKTDRAKRDMLKAAVEGTTQKERHIFPKMLEDILWILEKATRLEDERNDAVHSPLLLFSYQFDAKNPLGGVPFLGTRHIVIPNKMHMNPRAKKLSTRIANKVGAKRLLNEFRLCRDSVIVLRDFTGDICYALSGRKLDTFAWPDRPPLPNRGGKKSQPPQKSRHTKK